MNMQNLMAQAQKIQKDIKKKQEVIDSTIFEGKSELVTIKLNGKKEVKSLDIDKTRLTDLSDLEFLEDMITIAFNDALSKIDEETTKQLGMYGQGLNGLI